MLGSHATARRASTLAGTALHRKYRLSRRVIVCNIHIYSITAIPKLHNNRMLQIAPLGQLSELPPFLSFFRDRGCVSALTLPEMNVINCEKFTIPQPIYRQAAKVGLFARF